jgi:ferric-dicitrate binding protein FerR (iron transport regulator)
MSTVRQIIETYIKNTPSKSVQKNFALWLKDERNTEEKNLILTELWDSLDIEADRSTEESYQRLQSEINAKTQRTRIIPSFFTFSIRKLSGIAALLLISLLSAAFTYYYLKADRLSKEDMKLVECIVPNGEIKDVVLPDASQVRLNSGSILVYPEHFGKTRTVYLSGEAYFSVAKKNNQPFIVNTTDMKTEALGTVFNVCSYADGKQSSVTLKSGKVNVCFEQTGIQPVMLFPNERVSFNRKSKLIEKRAVETEDVIAWTKGNIVVLGMSMDDIVKTIERKYDMRVYFNSHRYKDDRITVKLDSEENIKDFMNILKNIIPGLRYKIASDELYIY